MSVTCRFERRDCQHSELFRSEYKRTNRTKQTKILRCFPHCCPEHLNRSYCGTSLCVRVEITPAAEQTTTVGSEDPTSLLLYAHFEEAQANFLSLNDEFSYDEVTNSIQTEQTPKGKWIQGTVLHDATTERSCLFRINPGARWYYEWESAATKAQRFTKHVLRAYIFQRISESSLRVVGCASSSEFMVMSYRRAPIEVRAEREALEALRAAANAQKIGVNDGPDNLRGGVAKPRVCRLRQIAGYEDEVWEERKLWECRNPDIMMFSKQLAMLYSLVHFVNALKFGSCLDQWSQLLHELEADGPFNAGTAHDRDVQMQNETSDRFSWTFLLPPWQDRTAFNVLDEPTDAQHEPFSRLVHFCSSLTGWLMLDKTNIILYHRFLRSYSLAALDKDRLRDGYVEAVKLINELIDRFSGRNEDPSVPSKSSLATLSEDIMTVVFQYDHLKPLRAKLMDILSTNSMFGMHDFVAQLRAQFIFDRWILKH